MRHRSQAGWLSRVWLAPEKERQAYFKMPLYLRPQYLSHAPLLPTFGLSRFLRVSGPRRAGACYHPTWLHYTNWPTNRRANERNNGRTNRYPTLTIATALTIAWALSYVTSCDCCPTRTRTRHLETTEVAFNTTTMSRFNPFLDKRPTMRASFGMDSFWIYLQLPLSASSASGSPPEAILWLYFNFSTMCCYWSASESSAKQAHRSSLPRQASLIIHGRILQICESVRHKMYLPTFPGEGRGSAPTNSQFSSHCASLCGRLTKCPTEIYPVLDF
jgi:hypothetical protein